MTYDTIEELGSKPFADSGGGFFLIQAQVQAPDGGCVKCPER